VNFSDSLLGVVARLHHHVVGAHPVLDPDLTGHAHGVSVDTEVLLGQGVDVGARRRITAFFDEQLQR